MQREDRPIHFSTELIHVPHAYSVPALQRLYFDLSQTKAAYESTDFSQPGPPRFYSKRGARTQSIALFLPDRVVLIEEWVDIALSDFLEKIRTITLRLPGAAGVQGFIAHTATIRTTFALTHYPDARVFLMDHACNQAGRISPHFGRPVSIGGLRFVLPETPEHKGTLTVVIESYRESLQEVYVEVKGVYGQDPFSCDAPEAACANIRSLCSFIGDNVYSYLSQYDAPQETHTP